MRIRKETEISPRYPIIYSFLDVFFFFSTSYPFTVSLSIRRTFIPGPLSSIIFVTYCLTAKITFIIACLPTTFEFPRQKSTQISEEKSPLISPNHRSREAIFNFCDMSVPVPIVVPISKYILFEGGSGRGI